MQQPPSAGEFTPAILVVRSNVYGDAVFIDGVPSGASGEQAHRIAPGRHTVTVTKPGHRSWETLVDLAPGESRTVRARLASAAATKVTTTADTRWSESIQIVREELLKHWGSGEPPAGFGATNEGIMGFQVRNPADANVTHRYSMNLREIAVAPDELAPAVVGLRCRAAASCIRQRICRGDECVDSESASEYKWFFAHENAASQVVQAVDVLIELAKQRRG